MIYVLIIAGAIALDRIVKHLVISSFSAGDTVPVLGDFFHITYVQNRGIAFSMLEGQETVILAATTALLIAGLVFLVLFRRRFPLMFNVGLSLVCGGGLSNVIDRATYGYVIDMFDFGRFPVFNVADIGVTCGCILTMIALIVLYKDEEENGEAERDE